MKNSKTQSKTKANVKELVLEKLRKTEGGTAPITGETLKDLIVAGGYLGDGPFFPAN